MRRIFNLLIWFCILVFTIPGLAQEKQQGSGYQEAAEKLETLSKKAESVSSVRYKSARTLKMYQPGLSPQTITATSTHWIKGKYSRVESVSSDSAFAGITIGRPDGFYKEESGQYIKLLNEPPSGVRDEWTKSLKHVTSRVLGTEIIDSKESTVFEFSSDSGSVLKEWIWNKNGLPLKIESSSVSDSQISQSFTEEYSEFVFEDIPDSMFEVPRDKILDMTDFFKNQQE